jgi:pyridoxamine 5'-phosphate oxidase
MTIAELRREYNLAGLRRKDLAADPFVQFKIWSEQATGARASGRLRQFLIYVYKSLLLIKRSEMIDLNAMTLATADKQGLPSVRVVLLKGVDQGGLVFYTNYDSRKGHELADNPRAALGFYWPHLERQICVEGEVSKVPAAESDAYFQSRPRGSRIAAWASLQSTVIRDRAQLEDRWARIEKEHEGREVPRPPHWGGYVLKPIQFEFWQGRPNRLHDRFRYSLRSEGTWVIERLSP